MTQKAVIIAAGNGSRLSEGKNKPPKPLRKVAGMALIERIIRLSKKAGITEFVIVVGYQKDLIINDLRCKNLGVKIDFVENNDWQKSNGMSVLAAKPLLNAPFVLLMSDHLFDFHSLEKLRSVPLGQNGAVLAVDENIPGVFDLDDATKVVTENGQIRKIGKTLENYNAVDTGMFLCSPELLDELEAVKNEKGDCSLSDGISRLAQKNRMGTLSVTGAFWQDVDTPATLKHAEKYLYNACRKPTDGAISRNFNRYVSLFMTRFFIQTPLSANQVTGITTLVGILAAYFTTKGDYASVVLGAFLFKLSSIMDGCDGEMSKLKYTDSKFGQWLDTISDNFTYLIYMIAVIIGVSRQGDPNINVLGTLTLFGLSMTLFVMFFYLLKNTNSGSLVTIQKDFQKDAEGKGGMVKWLSRLQFLIKRDFFALFFFFLAVLGQLKAILWLCLIGSNVTWMVLLSSRLGLFKPAVEKKI